MKHIGDIEDVCPAEIYSNKETTRRIWRRLSFLFMFTYLSLCLYRTTLYCHEHAREIVLNYKGLMYKTSTKFYRLLSESFHDGVTQEGNKFTQAEKDVIEQYQTKFECKTIKLKSSAATIEARNYCNRNREATFSSKKERLKIDVVSIGYLDRIQYMEMQLKTWATNVAVRSFWGLTEHDEKDKSSECEQISISDHIESCKIRYKQNPISFNKFKTNFYDEKYFARKKNPNKWLCAQSRLILGLGKRFKEYKEQVKTHGSNALPDYLVIVDDDTYINVELLNTFLESKNSSQPIAYSGCSKNLITNMGGFNLFLSKGSIERLITPLSCSTNTNSDRYLMSIPDWEAKVCKQLEKNVLGEFDHFYSGMSLIDIAYEFASKKNFCLFSGWFMKYLITEYSISEINEDGKRIHPYYEKNNCASNGDMYCKITSHVCNWQTPESLASITAVVVKDLLMPPNKLDDAS